MFKRKTAQLEAAVKALNSTAKFSVNGEKPRKGYFEVRVGGKPVVSLASMPRPFKKLRELDMDELAAKVAAAC